MPENSNIPLATIQKWLQDSLLDPSGHAKKGSGGSSSSQGEAVPLRSMIKDSKRLSAEGHLAIYQRSYVARLRDCMSKQFTALEYALGDDLFRGFADAYLQEYPSSNYNLITLGEKFPAYLEATRPDQGAETKEDWPDFMIELAQFEYAINIIFEEKGEEDCTLAAADTDESNLQLTPVFHVFQFQFPIRWYYTSFAKKDSPDLPLPHPTFCVIMRHNYQLAIHDLNLGQYVFLNYLIAGKTVAEAKQLLITERGVKQEQLALFWPTWKEQWVEAGFFRVKS
jgi:hypothetical protein